MKYLQFRIAMYAAFLIGIILYLAPSHEGWGLPPLFLEGLCYIFYLLVIFAGVLTVLECWNLKHGFRYIGVGIAVSPIAIGLLRLILVPMIHTHLNPSDFMKAFLYIFFYLGALALVMMIQSKIQLAEQREKEIGDREKIPIEE